MADIYIERYNASHIKVYSDDAGIVQTTYEFFRYEDPNFTPNKFSKWDGVVRMYDKASGKLPYGCLQMLLKVCKEYGWSYEIDPRFQQDITNVTREDLRTWIKELNLHSGGNPIEAYDYQEEALFLGVRYNRMVLLAATSAGKSLIAYMLTRYYEMFDDSKKTLIVVPSQLLVNQMYEDFKDYSSANGWSVEKNVHYIMEGRPKNANKSIYISTWQSIYEEDKSYFEQFGRIICDEVHLASGDSISKIMGNSTQAFQRIGMTGTLKNEKLHPILVQSNFGPIQRVVSTKQLIDAGRATKTNITMLQLDYQPLERKLIKDMSYQGEIEFLINHAFRNKVIESLALTLKGNSLILFDRIDAHQTKVYENLKAKAPDKKIFVINGQVDIDERADIKAAIENGDDIVLLASMGTMSTGVSIKKLHNLVFAHPSKSIIRILQSIGRLLRLHDSKEVANIYDIVDVAECHSRKNFALRHAFDRYGYYKDEQHPVKVRKVQMQTHEEAIGNSTRIA